MCPLAHLSVVGNSQLTYRVRSRDSYWSRPRTLVPGESHRYELSDPLEWEVLGDPGERHTLRPGEVARWEADAGVTYEPPRPPRKSASASPGEVDAAR